MGHKAGRSLVIFLLLMVCVAGWSQTTKNLRYTILPHYRLNYDKNVNEKDVQLLSKELQRAYEYYHTKLSFSPPDKITVYLYSSKERPRGTLLYRVFDDAFYNEGKIIVLASALHDEGRTPRLLADRVVARAYLKSIITCPDWMSETYALAQGYDFARFGSPTRGHLSSFSDLGEDLARADDTEELEAVYAGLAATAKFFIDQYGETKLDLLVKSLRSGHSLEEAFENAFGAKYDEVERAWAEYMSSRLKG